MSPSPNYANTSLLNTSQSPPNISSETLLPNLCDTSSNIETEENMKSTINTLRSFKDNKRGRDIGHDYVANI